jgi:squalene-associated FAD-dependent desaturase
MAPRRVAVVGAGLAGLSAAVALRRAGWDVEIFERRRLLGGKATSYVVDGIEVDNGQHVFLGCCTEFIDFVTGLGLGDRLHLQDRFAATLLKPGDPPLTLRAATLPPPLHLLPVLLGHRYLPRRSRLEVVWAILAARRDAPPSETFADWLERHHQGELARHWFWDPFLVPALNAPAAEVAANDARFVINTAFGGDRRAACFGFVDVPLARIAETAAERAGPVHLRAGVTGLIERDGAIAGLRLADGAEQDFDAVVLAVPPDALVRILGEPGRFRIVGLDRFKTAPIVDVHLWYVGGTLDFDFAALLDSPIQWVFQKAPGYLCCSLSAAGELTTRPEAELIDLCHQELTRAIPALRSARLEHGAATRDPDATFVPAVGLRRPGPAPTYPTLAIAGAWTNTGWPATMESAVRSGRAAARLIMTGGTPHDA